jgi:uncharacterized protein YggE
MPSAGPPQVVTTGTGQAHVAPDRATVLIGVQTKAASAEAAVADNSRRQRAVIDTLRALGLTQAQISTTGFSVSPDVRYLPNQPPRVTGYTVSNVVSADVRRLDDVGRVLEAAIAKGANEISGLQFYSSRADSARRSAMAEAVANAKGDAEVLARAAGGSLGSLIELSSMGSPIRPVMQRAMAADAVAAPMPPIEPGEQTISVTVTTKWAFVASR